MLHDIWTEVWTDLLAGYHPARRMDTPDPSWTLNDIWQSDCIDNWHKLPGDRWIWTAAWGGLETGDQIGVSFSICDHAGAATMEFQRMTPPVGWEVNDDKDWKTKEGACLLPESGQIDLIRLRALARDAMVAAGLVKAD